MKKMYREVFLSFNHKIINYNPEHSDLHWKMWGPVHENVSDNVCMQILTRFLETKAIDSTR